MKKSLTIGFLDKLKCSALIVFLLATLVQGCGGSSEKTATRNLNRDPNPEDINCAPPIRINSAVDGDYKLDPDEEKPPRPLSEINTPKAKADYDTARRVCSSKEDESIIELLSLYNLEATARFYGSGQENELAVIERYVWPSSALPLLVCFNQGGYVEKRKQVEAAIAETWNNAVPNLFKFIGDCGSITHNTIQVEFIIKENVRSHYGGLGNYGNKTVSLERWEHLKWDAVHEFGHVLGFPHEHHRGDNKKTCWQIDNSAENPCRYGRYAHLTVDADSGSIMHYCRTINDKYKLSDGDRFGVQYVYGNR